MKTNPIKRKPLFLADFAGMTTEEVKDKILSDYEISQDIIQDYEILVAYQHEGDWGCDSSSYLLLQHKQTGIFYEVRASHCNYYGFEQQFEPEEADESYLKAEQFCVSIGG